MARGPTAWPSRSAAAGTRRPPAPTWPAVSTRRAGMLWPWPPMRWRERVMRESPHTGSVPLTGVLDVLKPPGMTSHDVVDELRRLTGMRRIGHTGTLDPGACGVLVLCLGHATRIA